MGPTMTPPPSPPSPRARASRCASSAGGGLGRRPPPPGFLEPASRLGRFVHGIKFGGRQQPDQNGIESREALRTRPMRPVLLCPEHILKHVQSGLTFTGEPALFLLERGGSRERLPRGHRALTGDLEDPAFYRRSLRTGRGLAVVVARPERFPHIVEAITEVAPEGPLLAIRDDDRTVPGTVSVSLGLFGERVIQPALDRAAQRVKAQRVREEFEGADRVLILMQDDPDPDAIASALALKTLLGRTRATAPICTFGAITRPENVAMCKILDIEVEGIDAAAIANFDRV